MGVKLIAARAALAAGVPRVLIADGRVEQPVSRALAGSATEVVLADCAGSEGRPPGTPREVVEAVPR